MCGDVLSEDKIYFDMKPVMTIPDNVYITMTSKWAWWRPKSPASRLFTQPFLLVQIKENIKAPRHWLLCGELIHRWPVNSPRKGPVTRKMFPFDDVIMDITYGMGATWVNIMLERVGNPTLYIPMSVTCFVFRFMYSFHHMLVSVEKRTFILLH